MTSSTNPLDPAVLSEGAEYAKTNAEADKFLAEADHFHMQAELHRLEHRRKLDDRQFAEAGDLQHRTYRFTGVMDYDSVGFAREHLCRWQRMYDKAHDLEIVLNSPGGNAYAGFELYDEILAARKNGHTVTVSGRGMVASMAAIVLQAGDVRKVGPNTTLMLHKPIMHFDGDLDDMADITKMLEDITNRMVDIFAERAASSGAVKPFTKQKIKAGINRKDWFLSAQEALEGGLIDVIG